VLTVSPRPSVVVLIFNSKSVQKEGEEKEDQSTSSLSRRWTEPRVRAESLKHLLGALSGELQEQVPLGWGEKCSSCQGPAKGAELESEALHPTAKQNRVGTGPEKSEDVCETSADH
jgi:hypothetical protein